MLKIFRIDGIFIISIIIFIPILEFANSNFQSFSSIFFKSTFLILLLTIIAVILLSTFFSKLFKKFSIRQFSLVFSFAFFSLFYFFPLCKNILTKVEDINIFVDKSNKAVWAIVIRCSHDKAFGFCICTVAWWTCRPDCKLQTLTINAVLQLLLC